MRSIGRADSASRGHVADPRYGAEPVSRRPLEPRPRVAVDVEGELASETLLAEAGAYALTLSTNLSDLAVELHPSYVGHTRSATTTWRSSCSEWGRRAPRLRRASCAAPRCPSSAREDAA